MRKQGNIIEVDANQEIKQLFAGWEKTMIWSCLQGCMGKLYAMEDEDLKSARIIIGDCCFFAGQPAADLVINMPRDDQRESVIMIPADESWANLIESVYGERAARRSRFSIKKEAEGFDEQKLLAYTRQLPPDYTMQMIDRELFWEARSESWSQDLTSQFPDYESYREHGLGAAVLYRGKLAAGASSYIYYQGGIEIQIDTEESHRRQGLALACGSQLILECLKRGLHPNWDAHDMRSVQLAEKLGYHMEKEYTSYDVILKND